MPCASLSSKYAEDKQYTRARREAKKWLIFTLQIRRRIAKDTSPRCALKSSHFFASQADLCSNPTPPIFQQEKKAF